MTPILFHPDAEAEMLDAAVWYESQQEDLGKRFLTVIRDSLNKIEIQPAIYPVVDGDVRRALANTFPYGVLFRIKPDFIAVVAVMHLHRDPKYWKSRNFHQ